MEGETNCWFRRTPLETGLLLILVVTIPFLVAMIIIYTVLLVQGCPDCSITCKSFCNRQFHSGVLPMFLELNPNISMTKLAEKYEICPDFMLRDFELNVDHTFVASILKDVYVDDLNEQRYLCSAAVITFKWVIASSRCVPPGNQNYSNIYGIFVRAGSNYWTKEGSVHDIKRVIYADTTVTATVAAVELETEFPRLPSIRPIMLSISSLYKNLAIGEVYRWKSNDSVPLKFRKKYIKMESEPMIVFKDIQCESESKQLPYVFCATAVTPKGPCTYHTGFPVTRARILMGIDIGEFCDKEKNTTVYLIYDIAHVLHWLQKTTGVYVEHL